MDGKLHKTLTDCIRDIATGARDVEGCLQQNPDRAAELRPHLELWSDLNAAPKAQPNFGSQQRGQHQLLGALADMEKEREGRTTRFLTPALVKAAAVVAGVALLAGGAAGASAAFGGPNVPAEVLSGIGISKASPTGIQHANPNAQDGSGNAGQGIDNASPTGSDKANDNAFQGASNADDRGGNADGAGAPEDGPPDSPPAADSVPPEANVPESVPAGPPQ